jgi:hypothetical protein
MWPGLQQFNGASLFRTANLIKELKELSYDIVQDRTQ